MSEPPGSIERMDEESEVLPFDGDRHLVSLRDIVAEAEFVAAALSAAEIAQVRVLARAGRLAAEQAAGAPAAVQAHDMALRSIAAELGGALRLTDRTVQARIGEARELVELFPETLRAWEEGRITRGHVRVIVDAGRVLEDPRRAAFEAEAIVLCAQETPNRVRAEIEMLAARMGEQSFTDRHRTAARRRRVVVVPGSDGMCEVVATLPTVLGDAILDRLTRQAQAIMDARDGSPRESSLFDGSPRDARSIDQIRADVLSDMLLAGTPSLDPTAHGDGPGALGAIRAQVQVIVPAMILLGIDDGPADLVGRSPIDADTARVLAAAAPNWARVLTDPVDGCVLAVDRYRPALPQRRFLRARDQHCRFPGCRHAAIRCEIDHTIDAARGGPTAIGNLAHLCQRHHSMKQFTAWRVRQCGGGALEWTSPIGRVYREDAPAPPVAFVPAPPAERASAMVAASGPAPF